MDLEARARELAQQQWLGTEEKSALAKSILEELSALKKHAEALAKALEELVAIDTDHDLSDQTDGDICGPVRSSSGRLINAIFAAEKTLKAYRQDHPKG